MSRSKHKSKPRAIPFHPSPEASQPPKSHKIGDLLWCRENKKRYSLWWPAMVTYDPNQAIYTRTTARGAPQVHVQYFGISAFRGWVSHLQIEALVDMGSKKPSAHLGKKMMCEFDVALQEATEALSLSHKERKLKFIFNFDPPPPSPSPKPRGKGRKAPNEVTVKQETVKTVPQPEPVVGDEDESLYHRLGKRRRGRRRRRSSSNPFPTQGGKDDVSPSVPGTTSSRRKRRRAANDLVVSLNINGLDKSTATLPNLLVGQSPVKMDSFAVTVDTALNIAALNGPPAINGVLAPTEGRPKRSIKPNYQHTSILGKNRLESRKMKLEQLAGPAKRPALDPGSESGSEASGMTIASAILTPPSSGTEGMIEEEEVVATDNGEGSEVDGDKLSEGPLRVARSKQNAVRRKTKMLEGPTFRDGECAICDARDSNLLACQGHCFQTFHVDCLGLIRPPKFPFVCDECQTVSKQCYICSVSDGTLERCAKPKCSKFYHRLCIQDNNLFVFDSDKAKFTCPLHSCAKCVCNELDTTAAPKGSTLVQCVKCPLALHNPHCLVAGCNLLGDTEMICYLHIRIETELNLYKHLNMDTCLECGNSGSLYCCDFCSSAYHEECMEEHHKPVKEEDEGEGIGSGGRAVMGVGEKWICPACRDHDLPTYDSVVLCKFGVWRWWPGQVVPMDEVPDNIRKKRPGEGMFVVRFCGSGDYCWIHHGRTLSLSLEPGADPSKEVNKMCRSHGKSRASTNRIFKRACLEAMELYSEQMKLQAERKPLPKQDSKAYAKIKSNKYLVPRPTLSDDDLHSLPCQCTPESPCDDNSVCVNRAIHVECNPKTCPVGLFCHNQKMRRSQHANTVPFYTGNRGWGLKAASDINEGDFVVEYVGEVLDMKMCHERLQRAHETQTQHFYMLILDSKNGLVIDAKEKSNHARFINHSCDPNCETQKWTVGHESRVGIFANKFIKAGTELTFDYQLDSLGNGKKRCLCGSSNCSGYIGVRSKVEPKPKPKPKLKKKAKPASSHKPARRRIALTDAPPVEVTHENDCFICGDGGDLLCCDFGKCRKVYHLLCLGRKMVPPEKWVCPRHYCTICSKRAFVFCSACPISYCAKHRKDKFVEVNGEQLCDSCCNSTDSQHEKSQDEPMASNPSYKTYSPVDRSQCESLTLASSTLNPVTNISTWSSSPPPPLPPPPPPLPPPPPTMPSLSTLPTLSNMHHHPLSLVPHPFARHPIGHQPIQLLMPPSNLLYFNSPPFLSSSPSSLVYPSTYHH